MRTAPPACHPTTPTDHADRFEDIMHDIPQQWPSAPAALAHFATQVADQG